jgi:hypothetical protein
VPDRTSSFQISFDGEAGTLRSVLAGLKSQIRSDVAELEAITAKVQLFKGLEDKLAATELAGRKVSDTLVTIQQKIDLVVASGGKVDDGLTKQFASAQKQADALSASAQKQTDTLNRLAAQLKTAGVNTASLATEEIRLASALQAANIAATNQSAKNLLGFTTIGDVAPKIAALQTAFTTLQASGTLSANEIAIAQKTLQNRIAEVNATVSTGSSLFKSSSLTAGALASTLATRFIAPLAIIGTIGAAIKGASDATEQYEQGLAQIGSVTDLSKEQIAGLGDEVKSLSVTIGFDLNAGLQALFDLLRAGVPADNALEILRLSAIAANAALTDVGTGAKASILLLNAAGIPLKDLGQALDAVVQGAKLGGPTLAEFANSAGPLLSIAKSLGVPLNEIVAALTLMVKGGVDSGTAITDLGRILTKLNTADAQQKLHALGIDGHDLFDIFSQIAAKKLGLDQILELGVASQKSAAGIAALTNGAKAAPDALDRVNKSVGAAAEGQQKFAESATGAAKAFDAALSRAGTAVGDLAGKSSLLGRTGTALLNAFAGVEEGLHKTDENATALDGSVQFVNRDLEGMDQVSRGAAQAQAALAAATTQAANAQALSTQKLTEARQNIGALGADLAAQTQALNTALASDIVAIDARATAEVAALDRSKQAQADTAAATLQIELKAAADRLALITKTEADVTSALDVADQARARLAEADKTLAGKLAVESAQARIAALGPVLAKYQEHYLSLINLAQTYSAKAASAEQARVDIARSVSDAIRAIELANLDSLDQFVAKQQHVDELVAQARDKAVQGDIAGSKQLFDQAIAETKGLTTVVDENGNVVITKLQAQTAQMTEFKKITDAANSSIGGQGDASKRAAETIKAQAQSAEAEIKVLQDKIDDAKKAAEAGILLKVKADTDSFRSVSNALDDLTKPRTIDVAVRLNGQVPTGAVASSDALPTTSTGGGNGEHFARGGFVGQPPPPALKRVSDAAILAPFAAGGAVGFMRGGAVRPITSDIGPIIPVAQRYAAGGSVFRGPKVPGSGNSDTYPTHLQAGSFVIRKAASLRYGDGIMNALARFADGGAVTEETFFPSPIGPGFFVATTGTGPATQQQTYPTASSSTGSGTSTARQTSSGNQQTGSSDQGPSVYDTFYKAATADHPQLDDKYANLTFTNTIGAPTLPTDPAAKVKAIFDYIFKVREQIRVDTPGTWDLMVKALNNDITRWQHTKSDADLDVVLTRARNIGLNLGFSRNEHDGFDVDGRKYHPVAPASPPPGLASATRHFDYDFYAEGGPTPVPHSLAAAPALPARFNAGGSADTIPAILTPGEFVFNPRAVQHVSSLYGGGFLPALNDMRMPQIDVEAMMAPPPRVRHFADGGYVGNAPASAAHPARAGNTFAINIVSGTREDRAWVTRTVVPVLEDLIKKSRG